MMLTPAGKEFYIEYSDLDGAVDELCRIENQLCLDTCIAQLKVDEHNRLMAFNKRKAQRRARCK